MEHVSAEHADPQATYELLDPAPAAAEIDEAELMVKVAEEAGIVDHGNVDYDPFLAVSSTVADPGPDVKQNLKDTQTAAEGAPVKIRPYSDEPEWIFIGGSQRHKISGTNISAETSHFIMKKSSVTKMKEITEVPTTAAVAVGAAASASGENT